MTRAEADAVLAVVRKREDKAHAKWQREAKWGGSREYEYEFAHVALRSARRALAFHLDAAVRASEGGA